MTLPSRLLVAFQNLVRKVPVPDAVLRYAVDIVRTTRPNPNGSTPDFINKWVAFGASVRAAQYLILGGFITAVGTTLVASLLWRRLEMYYDSQQVRPVGETNDG